MSMFDAISREEFNQQIRDCLVHLYDFAFLQNHPLVQIWFPDISGIQRVQLLRETVIASIENLRPPSDISFHDKEARLYNILILRYVERQPAQDVIQQLALSDRQFYRDHPRAIDVLCDMLWEKLTGITVQPPASESLDVSVESEIRRISQDTQSRSIDLETLLLGAIESVHGLARENELQIVFHKSSEMPMTVFANRTILRQIILILLTQLTVHSAQTSLISITIASHDFEYDINFTLALHENLPQLESVLEEHEAFQQMFKTLGARLSFTSDSEFQITLHIPQGRYNILLVDDNPDILDLFRRYLTSEPYHIHATQSGDEAIAYARQQQPNIIILDIMLPQQDGFEILQNLKNHYSTQDIPVLICSVLEISSLSQSLGANSYLKKPPGQNELLNALAQWLE